MIVERNIRLVVIDHERVVLVEGKRPLEELHGRRRKAALEMLNIVDPRPEPKPQPELPAMEARPATQEALAKAYFGKDVAAVAAPPPPVALAKDYFGKDVEYGTGGKSRKHNKHGNYKPAMKPPLTGAAAMILAKLGEYDVPATFAKLRQDMDPMPEGTVSSRLVSLREGGYAERTRVKHDGRLTTFYRITARGEDLLTRPEAEEAQALMHDAPVHSALSEGNAG